MQFFYKNSLCYAMNAFFFEYISLKDEWDHGYPDYIDRYLFDDSVGVFIYFEYRDPHSTKKYIRKSGMMGLIFNVVDGHCKLVELFDS